MPTKIKSSVQAQHTISGALKIKIVKKQIGQTVCNLIDADNVATAFCYSESDAQEIALRYNTQPDLLKVLELAEQNLKNLPQVKQAADLGGEWIILTTVRAAIALARGN